MAPDDATVVIVDDDRSDSEYLARCLRERGIRSDVACDQGVAMARIANDPPAILIVNADATAIDMRKVVRAFHNPHTLRAVFAATSRRKGAEDRSLTGMVDVEVHKPYSSNAPEICDFVVHVLACLKEEAAGGGTSSTSPDNDRGGVPS